MGQIRIPKRIFESYVQRLEEENNGLAALKELMSQGEVIVILKEKYNELLKDSETLSSLQKNDVQEDSVTISKKEYEELLKDSDFLACLHGLGVDNWQSYDDALEMMTKENNE